MELIYTGNEFVKRYSNSKQKNMDILISFLIALGLHATPQDLKNKDFLKKNAAIIQQAQQMISEQGHPRGTQKTVMIKNITPTK